MRSWKKEPPISRNSRNSHDRNSSSFNKTDHDNSHSAMSKLRGNATRELSRIRRALFPRSVMQAMPQPLLQDQHVRNTKLLTDRTALLKLLPKNGVAAELGVDEGKFSNVIWTNALPAKLHLVDVWATDRYNAKKRSGVEQRFAKEIQQGNIVLNIGLSTKVVNTFPDEYFDWIYIDTDHTYRTTLAELQLYEKKMKKGGIMCGHDYVIGNWNDHIRYGVIEAVHEFCVKNEWELIYNTSDLNMNPSFAIRRIGS